MDSVPRLLEPMPLGWRGSRMRGARRGRGVSISVLFLSALSSLICEYSRTIMPTGQAVKTNPRTNISTAVFFVTIVTHGPCWGLHRERETRSAVSHTGRYSFTTILILSYIRFFNQDQSIGDVHFIGVIHRLHLCSGYHRVLQ